MSAPDGGRPGASPALDEARRRRLGVRAAIDLLERSLATPASGREAEWSAAVAAELRRLQGAFANHVSATEAPDGLYSEIMHAAPRLAHQIGRLRDDHLVITSALDRLVDRVPTAGDPAVDVDTVREECVDALARIVRHRHLGAELVYDAYNVDIEASD